MALPVPILLSFGEPGALPCAMPTRPQGHATGHASRGDHYATRHLLLHQAVLVDFTTASASTAYAEPPRPSGQPARVTSKPATRM